VLEERNKSTVAGSSLQ